MKLNTATTKVTRNNVGAETTFSIAANSKAFRALSSTLYTDKPAAIVREISCNAYDSHVAAGKPNLPIHIHLPDAFDPSFKVRDFGVGLSEEEIVRIYTVYFESTKDNSNDAIGAFGLGSKTPFSYTDAFTITSIYDGVKRTYSAFINETGMPSITLLAQENTDEGNGVEISVAVRTQDANAFRNAVFSQLKYFKVKPKLVNYPDADKTWVDYKKDTLFDSKDIVIADGGGGYYTSNRGLTFVQGGVGYKVDRDSLVNNMSESAKKFFRTVNDFGVVMFFDIGEIDVTLSRESIEYNKHTFKNVEAKVRQVVSYIDTELKKKISAFSTDYAKAKEIARNSLFRKMADISSFKFDEDMFVGSFNRGDYYINLLHKHTVKKNVNGKTIDENQFSYSATTLSLTKGDKIKRSQDRDMFPILNYDNTLFVLQDTNSLVSKRIHQMFDEHGDYQNKTIITVNGNDRIFNASDIAAFKARLTKYGIPTGNIVLLSDFEAERASRKKGVRSVSDYSVATSVHHIGSYTTGNWNSVQGSVEDYITEQNKAGKYVIVVETEYTRLTNHVNDLGKIEDYIKRDKVAFEDFVFIALSKRFFDKLVNVSGWTTPAKFIEDVGSKYAPSKREIKSLALSRFVQKFSADFSTLFTMCNVADSDLRDDTLLGRVTKFCLAINTNKALRNEVAKITQYTELNDAVLAHYQKVWEPLLDYLIVEYPLIARTNMEWAVRNNPKLATQMMDFINSIEPSINYWEAKKANEIEENEGE